MSDTSQGAGWWEASDGKWYPPETHPNYVAPSAPPSFDGPPPSDPSGGGSSSRGPLLAVVGLLALVGIGAGAFVALGGDDDDAVDASAATTVAPTEATNGAVRADGADESDDGDTTTSAPSTTEATDESTTTAETTEAPTTTESAPPPSAGGSPTCAYIGVDSFDDMQTEIAFTNGDTTGDLSLTVALFDGDDVRFSTSTAFVEAAQPNEPFRIPHDTFEELPAGVDEAAIRCEVIEVEDSTFGDPPSVPDGSACRFVELDFADDVQVEITVTNPFTEQTDIGVTIALRGPDGVRFDDSVAFIEAAAPGETVREAHDTLTELPSWVSVDSFVCEVVNVEDFGF